jgi:hypothetical protein
MKKYLLITLPLFVIACARAGYNPPESNTPSRAAQEEKQDEKQTEQTPATEEKQPEDKNKPTAQHEKKKLSTRQSTEEKFAQENQNQQDDKIKITCLFDGTILKNTVNIYNKSEIGFITNKERGNTMTITCSSKSEFKKGKSKEKVILSKKQLKAGQTLKSEAANILCVPDLEKSLATKQLGIHMKIGSKLITETEDQKGFFEISCVK